MTAMWIRTAKGWSPWDKSSGGCETPLLHCANQDAAISDPVCLEIVIFAISHKGEKDYWSEYGKKQLKQRTHWQQALLGSFRSSYCECTPFNSRVCRAHSCIILTVVKRYPSFQGC